MKKLTKLLAMVAIGSLFATSAMCADDKVKTDPETGLIIAQGFEDVKNNCTVCHTAKFIIAQSANKEGWTTMIRWMQKTQGLWEFDKQTEETILNYLATNYPQRAVGRRAPLPPSLMPPAPAQPAEKK